MTHNILKPRSNPNLLSIVIPCYNEEEIVPLLLPRLTIFLDESPYPCEVIVVNDGSSDRTIELLSDWCNTDKRIKVLSLSRNFGHQYAATAGIDPPDGRSIPQRLRCSVWSTRDPFRRERVQEIYRLVFLSRNAGIFSEKLASG